MSTSEKHSLTLKLDSTTYSLLKKISKTKGQEVSVFSACLVNKALELLEDQYWSEVAKKRLSKKQNLVSHKEAWK